MTTHDPSSECLRIAMLLRKLADEQVRDGHVCDLVLINAAERILSGEHNKTHTNDNTGLSCPDCGEKQQRVNAQWIGDQLHVRVSFSVDREHASAEVLGVGRMLRMLAPSERR